MNNQPSNSGETVYVLTIAATALIVGFLIVVQLLRAKPVDLIASLIISVCFVVAVIVTALWGKRSGI